MQRLATGIFKGGNLSHASSALTETYTIMELPLWSLFSKVKSGEPQVRLKMHQELLANGSDCVLGH